MTNDETRMKSEARNPKKRGQPYVFSVGSRESGVQTIVARASRPCVGCTIRTGGTPVPGVWTFWVSMVVHRYGSSESGSAKALHLGRCPRLVWAGPLARVTPSERR